jgi:hypothetical protein
LSGLNGVPEGELGQGLDVDESVRESCQFVPEEEMKTAD